MSGTHTHTHTKEYILFPSWEFIKSHRSPVTVVYFIETLTADRNSSLRWFTSDR